MKRLFQLGIAGVSAGIMLVCSCASRPPASAVGAGSALPMDVAINKDAGHGGLLVVTIRLESGELLPFVVDTGTGPTLIDKSLEQKLGERLNTSKISGWGNSHDVDVYAAPKLYLGGVPLITGRHIECVDFKQMRVGHVMGILGFDCLKNYCIQLDFQAGKMRFLDTNHLDVSSLGTAFPITFQGRPYIHHGGLAGGASTNLLMETNGDDGWRKTRGLPVTYALLDSGYDMDGRVDKEAAKGHNTRPIRLTEINWEGQTYTNLAVGVGENANILGLRFMARHLVTFDFPNHTLYLKQTSVGPLTKS